MFIWVHLSRNVEHANIVGSVAPDVSVQVDLEVLEVHVGSLAVLNEETLPGDGPVLLVLLGSGAPGLPSVGVEVGVD